MLHPRHSPSPPSYPNSRAHDDSIYVKFELQELKGVVGDDANIVHDGVHFKKETLLKQIDGCELVAINAIASSTHVNNCYQNFSREVTD
ncbi:hypothetical protein ACFXTI_014466 [Malus domestica]